MDKSKLIKEVLKQHPALGVSRGWSEYVGGMMDAGHWYQTNVMDAYESDLLAFLDEIKAKEEARRVQTEQRKNMPVSEWVMSKDGNSYYSKELMDAELERERKHWEYIFGGNDTGEDPDGER